MQDKKFKKIIIIQGMRKNAQKVQKKMGKYDRKTPF